MKLVVFTHKVVYVDAASPSGFSTDGGFPMQMATISELFDETTIVALAGSGRASGLTQLRGHNLRVVTLSPLEGDGARRKLKVPAWLLANRKTIQNELAHADAVHTPVPGDVGRVAALLATVQHKPLFVRHCGHWQSPATISDRLEKRWLEQIAGGDRVVLATGGGDEAPSPGRPSLQWIFSTSLTRNQIEQLAQPRTAPSATPRLLIVARQERPKGTEIVISALPLLLARFPSISLEVVGEGGALAFFKDLAHKLGVADRVTFSGRLGRDAVIEAYRRADLFCFPTAAAEGFPKVVVEAFACNLPVITTPISGLPSLLAGGGGVLLPERTPEALAAAVTSCLADAGKYRRMALAAGETARLYTLERWQTTIRERLEAAWGPLRARA